MPWTIVWFVLAAIAVVVGFMAFAASALMFAKIVFFVALGLAMFSFLAGRRPREF